MANTYVFRQIAYITIEVEANNEESAYEKVCEIDPLTGSIDYEEPELESIEDENGKDITTFNLEEMTDHYEIDENYESIDYHGFPSEGENENILLFLEENKGLVYGFNFESEEVPTPKDFSYIPGTIGTDDGDWDFIDKVFFKGKELEVDFDLQSTNGKALTVQLWTLND